MTITMTNAATPHATGSETQWRSIFKVPNITTTAKMDFHHGKDLFGISDVGDCGYIFEITSRRVALFCA